MKASVEVYAGRFDSSFDLTPSDGSQLDHDVEAEFIVKGIVKKVVLDGTRSGELRLYYVIHPLDVTLRDEQVDVGPEEAQLDETAPSDQGIRAEAPLEDDVSSGVVQTDDEDDDRFAAELIETPHGKPVSTVQPHSNVAGSSQAERDPALAAFLYGDHE